MLASEGKAIATYPSGQICYRIDASACSDHDGTASIGLMAIFLVDALNLLYISMLGEEELAAAIGYSGTLMFFLTSVAIGLTIATTAQVSRSSGTRRADMAAQLVAQGWH